jgi:glycerophosphoryl diester phosphodiesterase
LSGTTDADEKFPELVTTYSIDGEDFTGVFSTDLTLAQIKTLRAKQALEFRDHNYDGMFEVCPEQMFPVVDKAELSPC